MLIVKNEHRLRFFGFKKTAVNSAGRNVWAKTLKEFDGVRFSIVVNPMFPSPELMPPGKLELVADSERDSWFDEEFPTEDLMTLIAKRVVGWIPEKRTGK